MPATLVQLPTCPTCHRAFRPRVTPEPPPADLTPEERARLTPDQVIEYFKSTAPMKDVEFFLKLPLPEELRGEATDLLDLLRRQDGKPSFQTRTRYTLLHQHWREWAAQREADLRALVVEEPVAVAAAPARKPRKRKESR